MPTEDLKPNPKPGPIHTFEGKDSKMAWDREFRELLRANPGIIKTAIALTDRAVAEYNPPDNPLPNYHNYKEVKFDRKNNKWLEEIRRVLLNEEGKIYNDPTTGRTATEHAGWKNLEFGRGTILVPGEPITDEASGLEVTLLGRSNRNMALWATGVRYDLCDYLKINLKEQNYFVKRSFITNNPGFTEFRNIIAAREALKEFGFVKVVEAKLGYQDKKESWYVSKWEDLENNGFGTVDWWGGFNDYGLEKEKILPDFMTAPTEEYEAAEKELKEIEAKVELIRSKLKQSNIHCDIEGNLFYNIKTKTFILIDVTGIPTEELGNPIRQVGY